MDKIIDNIIDKNIIFYNFIINFGNFENYYFNNNISKKDYNELKSKFNKYNIKQIVEYSYLNMYKLNYKHNNKIIFYKKDFVKSYLIKNTLDNNFKINYFLLKENKKIYIKPFEFPNIKEKIISENKVLNLYKSINYNTEIIINFVEINNNYSIYLELSFDIKQKQNIILHLDLLFQKLFKKFKFIQL